MGVGSKGDRVKNRDVPFHERINLYSFNCRMIRGIRGEGSKGSIKKKKNL